MKLETQLAGGVVLVDVSKDLPRRLRIRTPRPKRAARSRAPFPEAKPIHRRRRVAGINRVFLHHSGASGAPGLQGLINSTKYSLRQGFHCCAYHVWVPEEPLYYTNGTLLTPGYVSRRDDLSLGVLRANVDGERTWHTGGKANTRGWSICLQGNKNVTPLTWLQEECLEALLPWAQERFELDGDWLVPHSGAGPYGGKPKPACPGKHTEEWLKKKELL